MKVAYHILMHLLGVGCIAACITIVATMGALDIHWSGWIAVGFFIMLAIGILLGWFPWRGKPMRVMLKGWYVMSALALVGFGFTMSDPWRPQLWMVLAPVAAAIIARVIIVVMRSRAGDARTTDEADSLL
jgi:peptidoglycan/LPS O-acetylase OafA/YrhL